jgi:xanthine dehydrogenase accessory factor
MKDVLEDVDTWIARGDKVAIATVVSTKRSAPRPPARRWRSTTAEPSAEAVRRLRRGRRRDGRRGGAGRRAAALLHFGIADEEAWDVGLPCGGEIGVWVERYEP